jgi:hypothetical protein
MAGAVRIGLNEARRLRQLEPENLELPKLRALGPATSCRKTGAIPLLFRVIMSPRKAGMGCTRVPNELLTGERREPRPAPAVPASWGGRSVRPDLRFNAIVNEHGGHRLPVGSDQVKGSHRIVFQGRPRGSVAKAQQSAEIQLIGLKHHRRSKWICSEPPKHAPGLAAAMNLAALNCSARPR